MTGPTLCRVCESTLEPFDEGMILGRIRAQYYRCPACGLVALPSPTWLDEAYDDAISHGDIGLLRRCRIMANISTAVIRAERIGKGTFLDWAGGYGALTRMMRDRGLDFRHHDDFAKNIFAQGFEDPGNIRYDLITAFEVVEHLEDPYASLAPLAERTDRLLFSTLLLPSPTPKVEDWWYYAGFTGQHITFHTPRSLTILADRLDFRLTSSGSNLHLFHRGSPKAATRLILSKTMASAKTAASEAARRSRARLRGGDPVDMAVARAANEASAN